MFTLATCLIVQAIASVGLIGHVTGNFCTAAFGTLRPGVLATSTFVIVYITGIVGNIYVSTTRTLESVRKGTHIFLR